MNFLKRRVAIDSALEGGMGYVLGRAWFMLYSVRKDRLGSGGSRDPIQSPHTHLMGGYQAKGQDTPLG